MAIKVAINPENDDKLKGETTLNPTKHYNKDYSKTFLLPQKRYFKHFFC